MAECTPGPWQTNGSHIYGGGSPERASLIAQVISPHPHHTADLKLIAAAPDLLAALIALVPADFDKHPDDFMPEWHAARAAIARAQGATKP